MSKSGLVNIGRGAFLVATLYFGWRSLRGEWTNIVQAISHVGPLAWLSALAMVLLGLTVTGFIWTRLLHAYGHNIPLRQSMSIFFVGQLGKYIPGSIWSFGAQAQMAVQFNVPARTSVAVGMIFLGWNIASALLVGSLAAVSVSLDLPVPLWLWIFNAILACVVITPRVVNWLGSIIAGHGTRLCLKWSDCGMLLLLMVITWSLYGLALLPMNPGGEHFLSFNPALAAGTFAIAYIVGVLIIFAPAGLGAREATLILLLSNAVGLDSAAVIALLTRVVHTICDFTIAGLAWTVVKSINSVKTQRIR